MALVIAAGAALATLSAHAQTQSEHAPIAGQWVGVFEFVVLGNRAQRGPAAVIDTTARGEGDQPAMFGEGEMRVRIENQLADHFFGRWSIGEKGAAFVCTMIDDRNFLCGGETANVVGSINGGDFLRMCWSFSDKEATSGCADLSRPQTS